MRDKLIFWAQALDNTSPDHIDMYGQVVEQNDMIKRQQAVSLISFVAKKGTQVFNQQGVRLTEDGQHFVVEVPSGKPDLLGRTAPIICYGIYDRNVDRTFGVSVANEVDEFSHRIQRCLGLDHFRLISESFENLKKKYLMKKLALVTVLVVVILGLLLLWA